MGISLCMIARNEGSSIERCLNSAKNLVDEIILVDTGSTDRTKEIAAKFAAKAYDLEWQDDFSKARNFALSKATQPWILVLDADETLDEEGIVKIRKMLEKPEGDAFAFIQRNYTHNINKFRFEAVKERNQPAKDYPGYVPLSATRLFRKSDKIYYQRRVHEVVDKSIHENGLKLVERHDIAIHHYSEEKGNAGEKQQKYLRIAEQEAKEDPGNFMAHYNLSALYEKSGDDEKALEHMKLAYKHGMDKELAFIGIGGSLIRLKRYDEAIDVFKEALSKGCKDPYIIYLMAYSFLQKKDFSAAKNLFNIFVKYDHVKKQEALDIIEKLKPKQSD